MTMQTEQATPALPPGYALSPGSCGGHWLRLPSGKFLRGPSLAPCWFPTEAKAIETAIAHAKETEKVKDEENYGLR